MATNFAVVELPPRILIGKSADFYGAMSPKFNGQEKLGPIWGLMQAKRIELGLPEGSMMIGATMPADSPEAAEGLLTQFVGCVVSQVPKNLLGLEIFEIAGGTYATCEHLGSMETMVQSVQDFYTQMLPNSGCTQRSGLHLEIYDERYSMTSPDSIMVIAAPVTRQ